MQTSFELELVTPERKVYEGRVRSVVFPAPDGLTGILPNHAPLLSAVDLGKLEVEEEGGQTRFLFVSDGFIEVADNKCRILADIGERAEDIDLDRAEEAVRRARERLKQRGQAANTFDFARAELALQRGLFRLLVARKSGR